MTFEIDGLVVEIKAKGLYNLDRFNKQDTMVIMNKISIWASEAAERYNSIGADTIAKVADTASKEIYNILDANGCYDNCR